MNKLKELRKQKKLSQEEISKQLNINRSAYSRYENEATEPDIQTLIKLADYFNTSIDCIVGHESEVIDLNTYPDYKKELIKKVISLTQNQCEKIDAYLSGMLEAQQIMYKNKELF